jgi:hypothetical protein
MAAIKYSVDIQITGGPRLNFSNTLDVDAYDRIDAVIPTGGAATDVQVAPAGAVLQLLLIKSSDPSDDVTFDNGGADVGLKSPMLLSGGAIGILASVETVAFKNATAADVTVTILVGRDATP